MAPLSTREEVREAIAAAKAAFPAWRDTPAPVRGQNIGARGRADGKAKGCSGAYALPRGRKDAEGIARRGAEVHQHPRIHGGRRAADGRRDDSERIRQEYRLHDQAAAGSGGRDHAVEFSGSDSGVEGGAGARGGQYGGLEACRIDAGVRGEGGGDFRGGGRARGRSEHGSRRGRGSRRRTVARSRSARDFVYRIERSGQPDLCRSPRGR